MMHINTFKKFNENIINDFIRKKIYKDEDICISIYQKINKNLNIFKAYQNDDFDEITVDEYLFTIDGFDIRVYSNFQNARYLYGVIIDDTVIKCSEVIAKKIYEKVLYIFKLQEESDEVRPWRYQDHKISKEDEYFTKKDARISFKN